MLESSSAAVEDWLPLLARALISSVWLLMAISLVVPNWEYRMGDALYMSSPRRVTRTTLSNSKPGGMNRYQLRCGLRRNMGNFDSRIWLLFGKWRMMAMASAPEPTSMKFRSTSCDQVYEVGAVEML